MQEFTLRAQEFIKRFAELQQELTVKVSPIITDVGPDLRIADAEQKAVEVSKVEPEVAQEPKVRKTVKAK